jgi:hypothetical protein
MSSGSPASTARSGTAACPPKRAKARGSRTGTSGLPRDPGSGKPGGELAKSALIAVVGQTAKRVRSDDEGLEADTPATFQIVQHHPIDAPGKLVNDLVGRCEEFGSEGMGLPFDHTGSWLGVVVQQQMTELMGRVETAARFMLPGLSSTMGRCPCR